MTRRRFATTMQLHVSRLWLAACASLLLAACNQLPKSGPDQKEVAAIADQPGAGVVQIVDVDHGVAQRLIAQRRTRLFSETLAGDARANSIIGRGDGLEVSIWEAPPATLFGGGMVALAGTPVTTNAMTLPEQVVDSDGFITVPFAGRIRAAGETPQAVEAAIKQRLKGKANQPEVVVRRVRNLSSTVTVVGEVGTSLRMPLTASGERLLDALAAAGGVRQPVDKVTVQVTRGREFHALPLGVVIRDPRQNVALQPGDVVTALFQPFSFTALGATGKNEEISFETQGITLAQGLARAGGLLDNRANPEGVFIFRFEPQNALEWPRQPVATTPEGQVPVVYRIDLRNPQSFFVMQNFALQNKDVLYISNAPAAELQKFLNLVVSALYPVLNIINISR